MAANYLNSNLNLFHSPPRLIFLTQNPKNKKNMKRPWDCGTHQLWYGSTMKNITLTFCPKFFSWLLHMYIDFEKILGQNVNVKFFTVAP